MNPRVTILASIYRSSEFLFEFLRDIKKQSIFEQMEIIFIDANEDYRDYMIIKPFICASNFKYIRLENSTIYEAWNKGIELSKSDIITNWNCDDRRAYDSLEKQVKFLEDNQDSDICYGSLKISHKPNETFDDCEPSNYWVAEEGTLEIQLTRNSLHCLPVWRKSIHDRFGMFDTQYFCAADYDMWLRVLDGGGKLSRMDDIVGVYYENPKSISRSEHTIDQALDEVARIRDIYK